MIGSCTLIVKDGGVYRVHQMGLTLGEIPAEEMIDLDKKYKEKPEATFTDEKDIYTILSANQCASPDRPNYSQYVGDRMWFVDLTNKCYINIEEFVNRHRNKFAVELETERLKQEKLIREKTTSLLLQATDDALEFCKELLEVAIGTTDLTYKPPQWSCNDPAYDSIDYRIGNFSLSKTRCNDTVSFHAPCYTQDYELIRGKFEFQPLFFKYLKDNGWTVQTINCKAYTRNSDCGFIATNGKLTLFKTGHDGDLRLVTLKTV